MANHQLGPRRQGANENQTEGTMAEQPAGLLGGSARPNMAAQPARQTMTNSQENFSTRYVAPERIRMDEELWARTNTELEILLKEWESENNPVDEETELERFLEEYWGLTTLLMNPFLQRCPNRCNHNLFVPVRPSGGAKGNAKFCASSTPCHH